MRWPGEIFCILDYVHILQEIVRELLSCSGTKCGAYLLHHDSFSNALFGLARGGENRTLVQ